MEGVTFRTERNSRPSGTSIHIFGAVKEKKEKKNTHTHTEQGLLFTVFSVFACLLLFSCSYTTSVDTTLCGLMLARRVTSAQRGRRVYRHPGFWWSDGRWSQSRRPTRAGNTHLIRFLCFFVCAFRFSEICLNGEWI